MVCPACAFYCESYLLCHFGLALAASSLILCLHNAFFMMCCVLHGGERLQLHFMFQHLFAFAFETSRLHEDPSLSLLP